MSSDVDGLNPVDEDVRVTPRLVRCGQVRSRVGHVLLWCLLAVCLVCIASGMLPEAASIYFDNTEFMRAGSAIDLLHIF